MDEPDTPLGPAALSDAEEAAGWVPTDGWAKAAFLRKCAAAPADEHMRADLAWIAADTTEDLDPLP